jgi:hypothetical protein
MAGWVGEEGSQYQSAETGYVVKADTGTHTETVSAVVCMREVDCPSTQRETQRDDHPSGRQIVLRWTATAPPLDLTHLDMKNGGYDVVCFV